MDKNIIDLDSVTLSAQIHSKAISCVEVMQAYLGHIRRINPKVNAIVALRDEDALLAEAMHKDQLLADGKDMGFLHGFPMAVKDLAATKGISTSMGSPLYASWVPDHDQIHVERMKAAGAIIIGKTNVSEFGLGSQSYNPVYGTTKSAYDISKTAGGSSGGAASAVAAKLVPVACGSDMMGSLRNPPAFNNVFGLRPSQGRIPFGPTGEIFYSQLGIEGAVGRTVKDVAMLFSIQAGFDARVPLSIKEGGAQFAQDLERDFSGCKIGWLGDFDGHLPMEDGVMPLCEKALSVFETLGCDVESVTSTFDMDALWTAWCHLRNFNVAGLLKDAYQDETKRQQLKPEAIWEIESGLALSGVDIYQASEIRSQWYAYLANLYQDYDFLVMPTAQVFPFDAECHWPKEINGTVMNTYHRWMEVSIMASLAGVPAINVPVGFSQDGLPMGMQILAPYQQDFSVLQMAAAYEKHIEWRNIEPAILNLEY